MIYMFLSNNPLSGDINSNLSCLDFIFTGWRCSSQHKSRYLFLDKGQVAKNLKQSRDSV